jgi:6-pyruvoyltetrahydropterin/6-carboxytetrahydropterin synthase
MKQFEVAVHREFSAAHRLRDYKGKCENFHGHNWTVDVRVSSGRLDKQGMVIDFHELKNILDAVLSRFDHAYLNELDEFKETHPTSENIAIYIFERMSEKLKKSDLTVNRVSVWETHDNCASVISKD